MNPIIKEIFNNTSFTEEESDLLFSKLRKADLAKGEFLIKADEKIDEIFYVYDGCLRSYFIDNTGKEHTLQFAVTGWWISDYIALFGFTKTNSVSYIECIKEATIYKVTKSDFDDLCKEIPKVGLFHIRKMELAFATFQKRILENLTLSAKERYLNFVKTYPSIVSSVKNYHIASFLGVTTESLSRIRKEISST